MLQQKRTHWDKQEWVQINQTQPLEIRHITSNTKQIIYNATVRSIMTYRAETWVTDKKNRNKIITTEMEYWREDVIK